MQASNSNRSTMDTAHWKFFLLKNICSIDMGNKFDFSAMSTDDPTVNFVGRSALNNGVMGRVDAKPGVAPYPAGALTVALGGSLGSTHVQTEPFYTSQNVAVLQFDEKQVSLYARLFLANMIRFESQFKYFPFGRELNKYLRRTYGFKLPVKKDVSGDPIVDPGSPYSSEGYIPDWQFMEGFIRGLNHKPLTTSNTAPNKLPARDGWIFFRLNRLCDIDMGNKMDFSAMNTDEPSVNFVGRSAENNGVMGKVDAVEGVTPYPAGCITVALGGSLGASFVQDKPFYTSQNVAVLQFSTAAVDLLTRLFLATMIQFESRSKYFPFGRELNKYIRTIYGFALPIERNPDGTPVIDPKKTFHDEGYVPDWQSMGDYMRSLPYGDRIPETHGVV